MKNHVGIILRSTRCWERLVGGSTGNQWRRTLVITVVEGYTPDESLEWDETTHMISTWGEVTRATSSHTG